MPYRIINTAANYKYTTYSGAKIQPTHRHKNWRINIKLSVYVLLFGLLIQFAILPFKNYLSVYAFSKPTPKVNGVQLNAELDAVMQKYPDVKVSVVWKSINTKMSYSYGSSDSFAAASTTKVLTGAYLLNQVEQGKISLDQSVGDYNVGYQLEQMINQSNNDSWLLLNHYFGRDKLQSYANQLGLNSYDYDSNKLSAQDETSLLSQLYSDKLLNDSNTQKLLNLMQNTNNEDLIPLALPAGTVFYHKYGLLDNDVHDAAIVEYNGFPYSLVIYSDKTGDLNYEDRVTMIHEIVKAVLKNGYNAKG